MPACVGRHRGEIARLIGRDLRRVRRERLVTAADVGARGVAIDERAVVGRDVDGVERHHRRGEARVGEHHLLVADFLDLESPAVEADLGDLDPVVAFAVDEDDLESAVFVGLGRFGDAPLVGRRGDARADDGKRVGAGDSAANDVGRLLGQRGGGRRTHPAAARRAKRRIFTMERTNLAPERFESDSEQRSWRVRACRRWSGRPSRARVRSVL